MLIPEIELNPLMSIKQKEELLRFYGEKFGNDVIIFKNLTPNTYQLSLTFKSFTFTQSIEINQDKEIFVKFPAEYQLKFKTLDLRGTPIEISKIILFRDNKKLEIKNQKTETIVTIPPGSYQLQIYNNDEIIGIRNIDVYGEQTYDIITNYQPIYPTFVIIITIIFLIIALIFLYYRKEFKYFYIIIMISLLIISVFLPWWEINGSNPGIKTSTNLYLIPNNFITIISTEDTIIGEASYLPIEFQTVITLMIIFTISVCFMLILNEFIKKLDKKRINQIIKILIVLSMIGTLSIFIIAINELSNASIGGIFGKDYLEIGVPGESKIYSILSNWGLSIGFYIYLIPCIIFVFVLNIDKIRKMKKINKPNKKISNI
jgi:hypothetical protein